MEKKKQVSEGFDNKHCHNVFMEFQIDLLKLRKLNENMLKKNKRIIGHVLKTVFNCLQFDGEKKRRVECQTDFFNTSILKSIFPKQEICIVNSKAVPQENLLEFLFIFSPLELLSLSHY